MTKNQLIYVKTVAEEKSISKAAKKLFISQPSLTNAIKKIEATLGSKLFLRTTTGLILTESGRKYYDVALNILSMYKDLEMELSDINDMKKGRLSIGITNHLANKLLPEILPKFESIAPNIELDFIELSSKKLEEALSQGSINFSIMHNYTSIGTSRFSNINFIDIYHNPFLLITKKNHSLSNKAEVKEHSPYPFMDLEYFKDEPFILTVHGQGSRKVTNTIFKNAGFNPNIKYTSRNLSTISKLVDSGLGVSFMPEIYKDLFQFTNLDLDFYSIDDELMGSWSLSVAVYKNAYLSKAAKLFINLIADFYNVDITHSFDFK